MRLLSLPLRSEVIGALVFLNLFLIKKEIENFDLRCIFCPCYETYVLFLFLKHFEMSSFSISVYSSRFSSQECFGNRKQCDENSRLWTGQRYQQHRLLQKDYKCKFMAMIGGWGQGGMECSRCQMIDAQSYKDQ